MSQFEGSKIKVRCADCSKLSGNRCTAKNTTVAVKKKRLCSIYEFKGEYQNRTPAEAIYVPHVDKKTRKMIRKLLDLGVIPVSGDGTPQTFTKTKELPMPSTTAVPAGVDNKEEEDSPLYKPSDARLIWTPGDE